MAFMTVRGAYGRTYKSGKAMKEDWMNNLDFQDVQTGSYITRDEAISTPGLKVNGRFKNGTGVCNLLK